MDKFLKVIGAVVVILLAIAGIAVLGAYPLKWAVNYLVNPRLLVEVFGTPQIGFWQAFSLNWIAGALIKSTTSVAKT